MIDLRKGLPNAIVGEDGNPILINTDYRLWIQFWQDIQEDNGADVSYLFADTIPVITEDILKQLIAFLYNPSSTPKIEGSGEEKILDYIEDGEYIFSALYATYGIDITEMNMHWHKFLALCNNIIGEKTLWGYAKSMRGYRKPSKNDTMEKINARQKELWSFPVKYTEEEQKKIDEFNEYWG